MAFGTTRMKKRQRKRQENRRLRKNGPDTAYLGGSKLAQNRLLRKSKQEVNQNDKRDNEAYGLLDEETDRARRDQDVSDREYAGSRSNALGSRSEYRDSITGIAGAASRANTLRDQALGTNALSGTAENVLAKRQAELAGKPTIGQATATGIADTNRAAAAQLALTSGRMNRQAMGLAGGMGEGGALAMQQALAQQGQASADALLGSNVEQARLAAEMNFNAAQIQNQQDIDAANLGLTTRMTAAEQERANQMAVANANAGQMYDSSLQTTNARAGLMNADQGAQQLANSRNLNLANNSANAALNQAQYAQTGLANANQNNQFLLGTAAGIDQAENQRRYNEAKNKNGFQKFISTVFDPGDLRGSGHKGLAG